MDTDVTALVKRLTRELDNFRDIAKYILPTPGEVPRIKGIDVFGGSLPLARLGGRRPHHVHRLRAALRSRCPDRARAEGRPARHRRRTGTVPPKAGIAVVDVAGHRMTDALLAAMLHQAFLLGALYELDTFGRISRRLFENLNTRFYQSSGAHKFV